jgi:hypothetical protein
MDEEIRERLDRLSPEARELFLELEVVGEQWAYKAPAEELVVDLHERMRALSPEDAREFCDLHLAVARKCFEVASRLQAKMDEEGE